MPCPQLPEQRIAENKIKQSWINLIKTNRAFFQAGGRLKIGDLPLKARSVPTLLVRHRCKRKRISTDVCGNTSGTDQKVRITIPLSAGLKL